MKQPVTFRLDRDLLEKARRTAAAENRTLTNFVETVLKRSIEAPNPGGGRPPGRPSAASGKS